jgi:uncharacterized protein
MYARELGQEAKRLANFFPVIGILGPRQSGKTTLAQQYFPEYAYFSLETPDIREFAQDDPRGFLRPFETGMILDEIQNVPELFSYIQTLVDASGLKGRFILTGSQNFHLNAHISQTLAGRIALLTLLPLSLKELQQANSLPATYEHLLFSGAYPRIHAQNIAPTDWYPQYIQTYIERDVRQLKNVTDLSLFQKFVKLCAGRVGQLINWSDLARDCGINYHTAQSWVSLLEASYVLFLLKPYHKSFNKRLVKTPKLYFYDTGLACALLNISSEIYLHSYPLKGNLFESFVVSELMKESYNRARIPQFYFWRDKLGHEIDLIIEGFQGNVQAIEIKSSQKLSQDSFNDLIYWQKIAQKGAEACYLIYGGELEQKRSQGHVFGWKEMVRVSGFD